MNRVEPPEVQAPREVLLELRVVERHGVLRAHGPARLEFPNAMLFADVVCWVGLYFSLAASGAFFFLS